jgi:hypothetical protein
LLNRSERVVCIPEKKHNKIVRLNNKLTIIDFEEENKRKSQTRCRLNFTTIRTNRGTSNFPTFCHTEGYRVHPA